MYVYIYVKYMKVFAHKMMEMEQNKIFNNIHLF